MKKYLLICLIFAVFCGAFAVSADPIKVAVNPDAKPFKYPGIDAEVMNGIAELQNLEVEYVVMDFEELLEAVASCEVDAAISALTLTEKRAEIVSFTTPYVMGAQSTYVRLVNDSWTGISDPSIKVIGAKAGTTSADSAAIISDMNSVEVRLYPDYGTLFQALENNEIDAAIADELLAKSFVDSYADLMTVGQPLSAETYAIAVCPNNPDLVKTFNDGLNELRRNGKLDQIVLDNLMPDK